VRELPNVGRSKAKSSPKHGTNSSDELKLDGLVLGAAGLDKDGEVTDLVGNLNPVESEPNIQNESTSWSNTVKVVIKARRWLTRKDAPMARPSVKLCVKSAARLRNAAAYQGCDKR
jgi:hypothetical protein